MNNAQRKRMTQASNLIANALTIVENVRNEEQEKIFNMPENLQMSTRDNEFEENVDCLNEIVSRLEEVSKGLEDLGAKIPARPAVPTKRKVSIRW